MIYTLFEKVSILQKNNFHATSLLTKKAAKQQLFSNIYELLFNSLIQDLFQPPP